MRADRGPETFLAGCFPPPENPQAGPALVKDVREGKWIFYALDGKSFLTQARMLEDFFATVQEALQKGIRTSPIHAEPCLCEELRKKIPVAEGK